MQGQEKIPNLIAQKGQELNKKLIPIAMKIAYDAGIKNIGTPESQIPDVCLTATELDKILTLRNNMLDILNPTSKTIQILSLTTTSLSLMSNSTSTILNTLKTAKNATTAAITLIPPPASPPGAVLAFLLNSQTFIETLSPKLSKINNNISNIALALDFTNIILFKLIGLLNSIDKYLIKCKITPESLTPMNDYLQTVEQKYKDVNNVNNVNNINEEIYKGFTLGIVEEQYTPTVKRIKGVAKNKQGIVLLQTPLSFTTSSQVLIEELKIIIDSNNLKAY